MTAGGLTRRWLALVAAAGAALCLSCSQEPDSSGRGLESSGVRPTLHYFTWSDYVGPEILAEFERQEQVRVVVDVFSSNEELLAKLQSGAVGYDVAVPSDFMVAIAMQLGLLEELDHSAIPNADRLDTHLQDLSFDAARRYSIPYLWGTVGIGYDSDVIRTPPDSWAILWDPRYKGRISMLNDQREVFGATLRWMGHSLNSTNHSVIEAAKMKLIEQKPLVKAYTSDHYDQLLATGEVVLAHGWGGPIARAMRERPSIRYVVPKEGGTIWADCLVVLKTARRKDLAMRFINYLLDPQVAARTSERLLFAAAPAAVKELVSPGLRRNPAVYPPDEIIRRLEWLNDVGDAVRTYDRAWTELKMH
jgi:spermidine/putrescine transport system substrate-binding protein